MRAYFLSGVLFCVQGWCLGLLPFAPKEWKQVFQCPRVPCFGPEAASTGHPPSSHPQCSGAGQHFGEEKRARPSPNQTPKEKLAAQAEPGVGWGGVGWGGLQRALRLSEQRRFPWQGGWEESPGGRKLRSSLSDSAHVKMNSVPFKNQQSCNFWDPWDLCSLG